MLYAIGAIIVFFIIVIYYMNRSYENSSIKGFWIADADFCEDAELQMFVLYIGNSISAFKNKRNGYLLVANKDGFILNNKIELNLSRSINLSNNAEYNLDIDWLDNCPNEEDGDEVFPNRCEMIYYVAHGKIVLYKDNKILASLWKDHQMSSINAGDLVPDAISDINDSDPI